MDAALLAIYWVALIVGGGLLLISLLGGDSHHADVGVDTGLDGLDVDGGFDMDLGADLHTDVEINVDHGHHGVVSDAGGLASWFSLRFLIYFTAVFGGFGVILAYASGLAEPSILIVALIGGLVIGQGVHQLYRYITRSSGDATPQPQDYVHRLARVTIPIEHPNRGQVVMQVRDARRYVTAVAGDADERFQNGDDVVVVGYQAGVARVVSKGRYEQRRPQT